MRKITALLITAVLLIGCSGAKDIIVKNQKYDAVNFEQRDLLIFPVTEDVITVNNVDDIEDDYEEDTRPPQKIIEEELAKAFTDISGGKVKYYGASSLKDLKSFNFQRSKYISIQKQFTEDSAGVEFYVPKKEELISSGLETDVIAVLNNVEFGRNLSYSPGSYIAGTTVSTPGGSFSTPGGFVGGGSQESLGAIFDFIIYDYNENDVIAYGRAGVKSEFAFAMTRSNWEKCYKLIARKIIRNSPFN